MLPLWTVQPVIAVELGASICKVAPGSVPNSKLPLNTRFVPGGGGGGGLVSTVIATLSSAGPPSPSVKLTNVNACVGPVATKSSVRKLQPRLEGLKPAASNEYSCATEPILARSRLTAGKGGISSGLPAIRNDSR